MLQDSAVASCQHRGGGVMGTRRAVPFLPGNNLVSLTTLQGLSEVIADFIFGGFYIIQFTIVTKSTMKLYKALK